MEPKKEKQFNRINSRIWMWFLPVIFLFTALIAMGFRELATEFLSTDLDMNMLFISSLLFSIPIAGWFSNIAVRLYLGGEKYKEYCSYLSNGFKRI
ncbi:MAG: hypothetical protein GY810_19460 [Aureispira sp.]|nr:hypothetical protein [Aureispira sp.]